MMVPKIGLYCDNFVISDALAIHILRSTDSFVDSPIELIFGPEEAAQCDATVGFGRADLEINRFSNDGDEYTLEKLAGFEGYVIKLSSAGQVYAKFAHQLLQQQDNGRGKYKGKRAASRDFRKLYEYMIEVVDSWHWGIPLQYPMPEKTQLLVFLDDLQNKIDLDWADQRETDFVNFAEQCIAEIGRKFDQIFRWYMDYYLTAFEFIIDTLKRADDFGVLFFDFNFSKVTLEDLLSRAGNNSRLPRLIIRPSFSKFRLECVRMVKPILYFPHEWVGRSDHVAETIDIEQIDYISSDRSYAIAQTLEAAEKLAYRLLAYAEECSNIVTSQDCCLSFTREGKKVLLSARSLPDTSDNSIFRNLQNTATDNDQSEEEGEEEDRSKKEKAAMELKILAGIETNCNEGTMADEEEESKQTMAMPSNGVGENNARPTNGVEDKENSPVLLLDLDESCSEPSGPSEERRDEKSRQMNSAEHEYQNGCTYREKQKVLSSSTSWNSFSAESTGINQPMNNNGILQPQPSQTQSSLHSNLNDNFSNHEEESEVENIVHKVLNAKQTVLEVPDNSFTISHVLGAAFVGLAIGTASQNLQIRVLTKSLRVGCSVRLGPGIYEYDDGDHKLTSSHLVSLFSLDLSSNTLDKRLTIAGLCYAFYAKKAIVRIASSGTPEGLSLLLRKGSARRKLALVFRRVYRRLVLPIDEWVSDSLTSNQQPLPPCTRESATLQKALSGIIQVANDGKESQQNGNDQQKKGIHLLSSDERLVAFRTALHICMQFVNDLVRSLLVDE